jgi:hypothetical protein
MASLENFRFFFDDDSEVTTFFTNSGLKDDELRLQVARVRRAWNSVRRSATLREGARAKVEVADLDDLVEETALNDVKTAFW